MFDGRLVLAENKDSAGEDAKSVWLQVELMKTMSASAVDEAKSGQLIQKMANRHRCESAGNRTVVARRRWYRLWSGVP